MSFGRGEALRLSLGSPHEESAELAEADFDDWAAALAEEESAGLVSPTAGTAVSWVEGRGWVKGDE